MILINKPHFFKFISIVLLFLYQIPESSAADYCAQKLGNEYVRVGDYSKAFKALKTCELEPTVSGLTLGQLALLYGYFGFGEFESTLKRQQKVKTLFLISALKGNIDSINSLIGLYRYGDKTLQTKPQIEKANCLEKLIKNNNFKTNKIKVCIG